MLIQIESLIAIKITGLNCPLGILIIIYMYLQAKTTLKSLANPPVAVLPVWNTQNLPSADGPLVHQDHIVF